MSHTERDYGFERLIFFSDAVFAIAITLLVLDVKLPHGPLPLGQALADTAPKLFAFLLSFMVIGLYWLNHHRLFGRVTGFTPALLRVNLLLLLTVSFLPFPTSVLAEYSPDRVAVIFYALSVGALGLMHFFVALVALRAPLLRPHVTPAERRLALWRSAMPPLVFGGSVLIALHDPGTAMLAWLALPVALLLITRLPSRPHGTSPPPEEID